MLSETAGNDTIELYCATRFPFEWKLHKVLFSNVRAVGTTPVFLDEIWYFLTTSARHGNETFLFWSKTLDGVWHYHRRNPICSDVRRARGAGPLFRSGDMLIRPAQDCSVRYGYAIALNRLRKISPTDYEEELIEVSYPNWRTVCWVLTLCARIRTSRQSTGSGIGHECGVPRGRRHVILLSTWQRLEPLSQAPVGSSGLRLASTSAAWGFALPDWITTRELFFSARPGIRAGSSSGFDLLFPVTSITPWTCGIVTRFCGC